MDALTLDATILTRGVGQPSAAQMAKITPRLTDPSVDTSRLFAWEAVIVTGDVDRRHVKLTAGSLDRLAASLKDGTSFMASDLKRLPLGQSYDGRREGDRVIGSFFTTLGIQTGEADSTSFASAVRAGVIRHVRAVVTAGTVRCSICGGAPFDVKSQCLHVPGAFYGTDGRPAKSGGQRAHLSVDDAELSAVMVATEAVDPSATILARHVEAGRLKGREALAVRSLLARRPLADSLAQKRSERTPATLPHGAEQFVAGQRAGGRDDRFAIAGGDGRSSQFSAPGTYRDGRHGQFMTGGAR